MPPKKIGVLISGSGTNLQSLIDNINNKSINAEIAAVISNKEQAYGLVRARQNHTDAVFVNENDFESFEKFNEAIVGELKKRSVDLVVLAGYLKILSKDFIKNYENKIINIHPSLIPAFCGKGYYGLRVHEAAIEYGVKVSGATVHFVDECADTGPIILQEAVNVSEDDTKESLQTKVLQIEHKLLPMAVSLFCENKLRIEGRKVTIK